MKIASLFKLTFSLRTVADMNQMKRIRRTVLFIDLAYYLFSILLFAFASLYSSMGLFLLSFYWTISVWTITLTSYFSIRRINRYTELLGPEKGSMLPDERFLLFYNGCFIVASIFDSASLVTFVYSRGVLNDDCEQKTAAMSVQQQRAEVAYFFFLIMSSMAFFGAHILMLVMLMRSSKRLDEEKAARLTNAFRGKFNR